MGNTGISSQIRTKLRDWAVWQARAGCYSQAALSSNDSKTLYFRNNALRSFPNFSASQDSMSTTRPTQKPHPLCLSKTGHFWA